MEFRDGKTQELDLSSKGYEKEEAIIIGALLQVLGCFRAVVCGFPPGLFVPHPVHSSCAHFEPRNHASIAVCLVSKLQDNKSLTSLNVAGNRIGGHYDYYYYGGGGEFTPTPEGPQALADALKVRFADSFAFLIVHCEAVRFVFACCGRRCWAACGLVACVP